MVLRTESDWEREPRAGGGQRGRQRLHLRGRGGPAVPVLQALPRRERYDTLGRRSQQAPAHDREGRPRLVPVLLRPRGGAVLLPRGDRLPAARARPPDSRLPAARVRREHAQPLPGRLHAGRAEPLLPRRGLPGTGLEGRPDRRRPACHERRRGLPDPGAPLGRPDDGVHQAGLRAVRPLAGRGGRAGSRAPRSAHGARTAGFARSGAPHSAASSPSTRSGSTPRSSAPPSACRAPSPTATTSSTG